MIGSWLTRALHLFLEVDVGCLPIRSRFDVLDREPDHWTDSSQR